jgi:hypothetical protein
MVVALRGASAHRAIALAAASGIHPMGSFGQNASKNRHYQSTRAAHASLRGLRPLGGDAGSAQVG